MPQVDLETLVSAFAGGGIDRKIACETLASAADDNSPPESFTVSKNSEFDWLDQNAILDRKESSKGIINPNLNPNFMSSQRIVKSKSKASMIGLPRTHNNSNYLDSTMRRSCRCGGGKPANVRLFPPRRTVSSHGGEPSSPKVSCIGRVRSKRSQQKSKKSEWKKTESKKTESVEGSRSFYKKLISKFLSNRGKKAAEIEEKEAAVETHAPINRRRVELPVTETVESTEFPAAEAPGLGAVKRFASGRR